MKRIGPITAAALLLAPMSSAAGAQQGSPGENRNYVHQVQDFCTEIVGSDDFPGLNWGECMSFNVVSEDGFRTAFCKALREGQDGGLESWGFEDFDDCVQNLEF
jgi:hypothetical protein